VIGLGRYGKTLTVLSGEGAEREGPIHRVVIAGMMGMALLADLLLAISNLAGGRMVLAVRGAVFGRHLAGT